MKILVMVFCAFLSGMAASYGQFKFVDKYEDPFVATKSVTSAAPNMVECTAQDPSPMGNASAISTADDMLDVTNVYSCKEAREANRAIRFEQSTCAFAIACKDGLVANSAQAKKIDTVLDEAIAKDYAKNLFNSNVESMEHLDLLKKFAQKKYNQDLGKSCEDRFVKKENGACNSALQEDTFTEYQKTCGIGSGCYSTSNDGLMNFETFESKNKNKKDLMNSYLSYRINHQYQEAIDNDEEKLKALAELVTSNAFKKMKPEDKANAFMNGIGLDNYGRLKDPVLGFDFSTQATNYDRLRRMGKFKDLESLYNIKNISKANFIKKFDQYRKERAEAALAEESCQEVPTSYSICRDMTVFAAGKKMFKGSKDVEKSFSTELREDKYSLAIKKLLGGTKYSEKDYATFLDARRCLSLNIEVQKLKFSSDSSGNGSWSSSAGSSKSNKGFSSDGFGVMSFGINDPSAFANKGDRSASASSSSSASTSSSASEDSGAAPAVTTSLGHEQIHGNTAIKELGETTPIPLGDVTPHNYAPTSYPYAANTFDPILDPNTTSAKKPVTSEEAAATSTLDQKVNELTKKLAAAEERMEKMKVDEEEKEASREKQKMIDKENALIADLQNQIKDLKAKRDHLAPVSTAIPRIVEGPANTSVEDEDADSTSQVRVVDAIPTRVRPSDDYETRRNTKGSNEAAIEEGGNVTSAGGSVQTGSGGELRTGTENSIALTTEGLSKDKAETMIMNRIIELKGAPFIIEEDGVIKEIFPVLNEQGDVVLNKEGNPVFEKIVKGKVGDKKFAKIKIEKAPMRSVADVKKDEEKKVEKTGKAVRYGDFLNAVKGVFGK